MNHTIKGIIIVAAITSMLILGASMIPLAQNTYASSHRHQDNILNQGDDTYRSPGSDSSNVAIQESGKGNSATSFSDQSSNLQQQQQNQPTSSSQQQNPQANKDKDKQFPITLNVLPDQRITNTNVNPNRNTAGSNSSSVSDASNDNTINNTALARQRQAEASCAGALTCPEGSTTVTPTPPTATCNPSTVGGITATPTDGTCTASLPAGATDMQVELFSRDCGDIGGTLTFPKDTGLTCTFPSTPT
jgi:hypothetical protein